MDIQAEVREFLSSRRAKLAPADVGLPDIGRRRVRGLRRGEVATLADISVEYYSKLEHGSLAGVSASVLDSIARALRLDEAERSHLFNLARASDGTSELLPSRHGNHESWVPRPSLSWMLENITGGPALVRNGRMDLLATNGLGRAMHSSLYERTPGRVPNFARYTFLDDDSLRFYPEWDKAADTCVAILHTEAGRDPRDPLMHELVDELNGRSEEFRRRWPNHDVRLHGAGRKIYNHTAVGDLELAYESVDMVAEPGLTLTMYAAEPGSRTAVALEQLAAWAVSMQTAGRP